MSNHGGNKYRGTAIFKSNIKSKDLKKKQVKQERVRVHQTTTNWTWGEETNISLMLSIRPYIRQTI